MFGAKPKTYQDIVQMKICQQLQAEFPQINDEILKEIYTFMVENPHLQITIYDGAIHFDGLFGDAERPDIPINDARPSAPWRILNNVLYVPGVRNSSYDSGSTSGNNNNNNNNNA